MDEEPEDSFSEEEEEFVDLIEEPSQTKYGTPHNKLISASIKEIQHISPTRTTFPYLSRYEVATLIGRRAEMIEQGAPPSPYITIPEEYKTDQHYAIRIAIQELYASYQMRKNILPLKIHRTLGDGTIEEWTLIDEKTSEILLALKDDSINEQMF